MTSDFAMFGSTQAMGSRGGAAGAAAAEPLSLFLKPYNTVPPQLLNAYGEAKYNRLTNESL